jgi:hypothetical protein
MRLAGLIIFLVVFTFKSCFHPDSSTTSNALTFPTKLWSNSRLTSDSSSISHTIISRSSYVNRLLCLRSHRENEELTSPTDNEDMPIADQERVMEVTTLQTPKYRRKPKDASRSNIKQVVYNSVKDNDMASKAKANTASRQQGLFMSARPSAKYRTLTYDYLQPSSLQAIECLPVVPMHKTNKYLYRWWCMAKKWNIMSNELKQIERTFEQFRRKGKNNAGSRNELLEEGDVKVDDDATIEEGENEVVDELAEDVEDDVESSSIIPEIEIDEDMVDASTQSSNESDHLSDYDDEEDIQILPGDDLSSDEDDASIGNMTESTANDTLSISSLVSVYDSDINDDDDNNSNDAGMNEYRRKSNVAVPYYDVPFNFLRNLCKTHHARVICISDVHGCIDELLELLRKVEYRPGDVVLFLGDLVAKGPYSSQVIELAMDLNALCVRGNHEQVD